MTDNEVLLQTEHTTILDTRQMSWQPHFGIPGAFARVLSTAADGAPLVFQTFLPEDFDASELPARQSATRADESTLVLDGELSTVEYGPDGPVAITATAGWWLHHPRGAAFGIPDDWAPPAGALLLTYRSSPGTLPAEAGFPAEVTVGAAERPQATAAPGPTGVAYEDPASGARAIDTRAMPWTAHFGMLLGRTRTLAADPEGVPLQYLTKTPGFAPGQVPPKGSAERHFHRELAEQIFVTGGEITMREYDGLEDHIGETVVLRPGHFVDRTAGSVHQLERRSETGFASLEVRDRPGNYPFDGRFDELTYVERVA